MLEQEIKILDIDTEKLVNKLLQHGAVRTFSWFITDTVFCHSKKKLDFTIRIRKKNISYYVTFKKQVPHHRFKRAIEIECKIHDASNFMMLLQNQGFFPAKVKNKMRVSYRIWKMIFDIDCYAWIPPFLEIEAINGSDIDSRVKKLWLTKNPQLNCWINGVLSYYNCKL